MAAGTGEKRLRAGRLGAPVVYVMLAFCSFWCWEALIFYAPAFHEGLDASPWSLTNYGTLVACVLAVAGWRRMQAVLSSAGFRAIAALLLEAGTAASLLLGGSAGGAALGGAGQAVYMASVLAASAGIVMMDLLLVSATSYLPDPGRRAWAVIGGSVSHLLLYLGVCALPPLAGQSLAALLPLVALALLSRSVNTRGEAGPAGQGGDGAARAQAPGMGGLGSAPAKSPAQAPGNGAGAVAPGGAGTQAPGRGLSAKARAQAPATAVPAPAVRREPPVPLGYLAAFFVISFSINYMRAASLGDAGATGGSGFSSAGTIALTLALVALAGAAEYVHGLWRGSSLMPLAAVAYVSAAMLLVANGSSWAGAARALVFASFFIYVTVFYRVATERAVRDRSRLVLVAASVFASNSLGLSAGSLAFTLTQGALGGGTVGGAALSLAYLVFIAGTFLQLYMRGQAEPEGGARGFDGAGARSGAAWPDRQGKGGAGWTEGPGPAGMPVRAAGGRPAMPGQPARPLMGGRVESCGEGGWADPGEDGAGRPGRRAGGPAAPGAASGVEGLESRLDLSCQALARECGLTAREEEVLRLLARQLTYLQVADEMGISPNTAKSHIRHVYQKLDVHSGSELFALVLREG